MLDLALLLLAFTAGMVAFFSPCCIAMLPAYVSFAVQRAEPEAPESESRHRWVGAAVSAAGLLPAAYGGGPLLQAGLSAVGLTSGYTSSDPASEQTAALFLLLGLAMALGGFAIRAGPSSLRRGAAFGAAATAGLITVFLLIGLPIAIAARSLAPSIPYLAVAVGVVQAGFGVLLLGGKSFQLRVPMRAPDIRGSRGHYLFGIGYGLASLSCTFPVFLAVMGIALVSGGIASGLAVFGAYALGKGSLLVGVATLAASSSPRATGPLLRLRRYAPRASGALLLVTGLYIAWYFGKLLAA